MKKKYIFSFMAVFFMGFFVATVAAQPDPTASASTSSMTSIAATSTKSLYEIRLEQVRLRKEKIRARQTCFKSTRQTYRNFVRSAQETQKLTLGGVMEHLVAANKTYQGLAKAAWQNFSTEQKSIASEYTYIRKACATKSVEEKSFCQKQARESFFVKQKSNLEKRLQVIQAAWEERKVMQQQLSQKQEQAKKDHAQALKHAWDSLRAATKQCME